MASGCVKKVDPYRMFSKLKSLNAVAGACIPSLSQQKTYKTDIKAKVVNPRPLTVTRIYEKKVILKNAEAAAVLAKEEELSDKKEKINVYKSFHRDIAEDNALKNPDFFKVKEMVDLHTLFKNRVHFGHHHGCRHPFVVPFLYGVRQNTDIFDLDKTLPRLHNALNFIAHMVYRGGVVLFVSRNAQTMPLVEHTAQKCGEYSHCRFWKGGLLTNIDYLYKNLTRYPDVVVFIHTQNNFSHEHAAITECAKMLIPTVGIVDSNCNPTLVTYPVPGNDDSLDAVKLYCKLFEETILRAKEYRKRDIEELSDDSDES